MKKNILFLVVSIAFLVSCKKGFLDGKPYSFITEDNFYKTAGDAELALTGCYNILLTPTVQNTLGGIFQRRMQQMSVASTDEAVARNTVSDPLMTPFGDCSYTSEMAPLQEIWFFSYAGIYRCNKLLDKLPEIEINAARKTQIEAEARFLRGLLYYYLGMVYGGVPLVTTTVNMNITAPRDSLSKIFNQSINDFDFAYKNLPNRGTVSGRASKWSGAGFLAKLYTYLASCKKNNVNADLNFPLNSFDWVNSAVFYDSARIITNDIIANSGYKLTANYNYLFRETTKTFQDEECLFVLSASSDPANGNQWFTRDAFTPNGNNNLYAGGTAKLVPTGEFYNYYNAADIRRDYNITGSYSATSGFEMIEGVKYFKPAAGKPNQVNFYVGKYRQRDPALKPFTVQLTDANYPLLRYADILLLNAEAIVNTGGSETAARAQLSKIRARATTTGISTALDVAYKKANINDEILEERARELCYESHRRYDLIRNGKFLSTIMSLTTDRSKGWWNPVVAIIQQNAKPYRIWMPVPSKELLLNKNLIQNPGY